MGGAPVPRSLERNLHRRWIPAAAGATTSTALLPRHQPVEPATVALQEPLVRQLLPDLRREAAGRLDREDAGLAPAAHRPVAEAGVVVQLGNLDALLERLERALEFFLGVGHGPSFRKECAAD